MHQLEERARLSCARVPCGSEVRRWTTRGSILRYPVSVPVGFAPTLTVLTGPHHPAARANTLTVPTPWAAAART